MVAMEYATRDRLDSFLADSVATVETAAEPLISIVVPTRNEAGNIAELLRRIEGAATDLPMEVLFVDDSTDETPAVIAAEALKPNRVVRLFHRSPERRTGGLGGAVIEGFRIAHAPWVCVMDADLQHPPELVPQLLEEAHHSGADLVVASRYCENGGAESFGMFRSLLSRGSTVAARALFPNRLRDVTDPMSGFFLCRREAIDLDALRPCGFKILLEIIGRTPDLRISSVPFQFGDRFAGESKAAPVEGWRYVRLLAGLRFSGASQRFARFGLVGASGLVVNTLLLALMTQVLGIYYLYSLLLATQGSTLWNFCLAEFWVFGRDNAQGRRSRAALFFAMNNVALLMRGPLVYSLTSVLGINYLVSNVASLVALMLLRFALADRLIWAQPRPANVYAAASAASEGV
jgi:dolichol-phosphate mannosyltransferase